MIAGYSPHKNFFVLPRIAESLKASHDIDDVVFVTTLEPGDSKTAAYLADAKRRGVSEMTYNFGPVPHAGCAELYDAIDAVILPSRLESFSNTIAEAWTMGKPLIVSDLDWAREACGDGALYVGYDDAEDTATKIARLRHDDALSAHLIEAGKRMMASYPSSEERSISHPQMTIISSFIHSIYGKV